MEVRNVEGEGAKQETTRQASPGRGPGLFGARSGCECSRPHYFTYFPHFAGRGYRALPGRFSIPPSALADSHVLPNST